MLQEVDEALHAAGQAQPAWAGRVARKRLQIVGNIPQQMIHAQAELLAAINRPNASDADKAASELLPLADACRFAAKVGRQVLAPHHASFWNGAWWMGRTNVCTLREPWGSVLILAPYNYPLFLPGVHMVQALAAGNAVLVKPAPGCEQVLHVFKRCLVAAGIPQELVQTLPTSIEAGQAALRAGVDKVILTGSIETGRAVLREVAETITPATVELSGCDAVFVLPQADLARVARAIAYALCLNGGETCIAPRRIFVTSQMQNELSQRLAQELDDDARPLFEVRPQALTKLRLAIQQALEGGAQLLVGKWPIQETSPRMQPLVLSGVQPEMDIARLDVFAPVTCLIQVADMMAANTANNQCPYALGVSIFGPQTYADHWAHELNAGCVVINDLIVPTGDPRVSFGGRHDSGFGVTRGSAGLLEMTRPKTICTRRGKWLPHLDNKYADDCGILLDLLKLFHSRSIKDRFLALRSIMRRSRSGS